MLYSYKSWCLSQLRDQFSKLPVASELVPVLWCLTGAEFYGGNIAAAETHYGALKVIVEEHGGLRSLPDPLCDLLIAADMTLTQTRAIPYPAFSADDWDPGTVIERLLVFERTFVLNSLPFAETVHPQVPRSVQMLFEAVRELLAVYNMAHTLSDSSRRTPLFSWLHRRQYALVIRILSSGPIWAPFTRFGPVHRYQVLQPWTVARQGKREGGKKGLYASLRPLRWTTFSSFSG